MFDTNILLASLFFGSIGMGYLIYGKKQQKYITFIVGIILSIYPFFVTNIYIFIGVGIICVSIPFISYKLGLE